MADIFNIAGRIHSTSQEEVVTTTDEILDENQGKKQSKVNSEVGEELAQHTIRLNALTGQNYVTVVATQSTTAEDIPTLINATGEGEHTDTIYRVGFWDGTAFVADKRSEYAWNGTAYVLTAVQSAVDDIFDVSVYNADGDPAVYDNLSGALAGVPVEVQNGGMTVKFIHRTQTGVDGNYEPVYSYEYVQYRLMATEWSTTESDWQGVDDEPTAGSKNLVESGGVKKALNKISRDIEDVGIYICDSNGKALVRLDILDTKGGFGENLVNAINNLITSGTAEISSNISLLAGSVEQMQSYTTKAVNIKEDGFYICDSEGNAFIRLDVLDTNGGLGENIISAITSLIDASLSEDVIRVKDVVGRDHNLYITDNEGNVLGGYIDDKWVFSEKRDPGYYTKTGDLANGDVWVLSDNSVKHDKRIMFSGDVTSFTSITIGHGHGAGDYESYGLSAWQWDASRIVIDTTYVTVYNQNNSEISSQYAHGLTIKNNIQVEIKKSLDANADLRVVSNGIMFTQSIRWDGSQGDIFLNSNSVLKDCVFSWTCSKLDNTIWVYGASFITYTDPARWPYYLINNGYQKFLLCGWPGAGSVKQIACLKNVLKIATPRTIIWAMGMNDYDNKDGNIGVNPQWYASYKELEEICKVNNIELILTTTPNAISSISVDGGPATISLHDYKNAIVRESGYRYIDFAKAVGANAIGEWYEGMKNPTDVHSTVAGAKAMYMRAICDVPELTY